MDWSKVGRAGFLLQHAIQSNRLAHAYLFTGPEGMYKLEMARMFARAILCKNSVDKPCNECLSCRKCLNGNHPDIIEIHPEGASIKIDQIRSHQKLLSLKSVDVSYKIYIVDRADSMTTEAANSLLKVLEEPVSPVVAILIAKSPSSVLPTILSRCQRISFERISSEAIRADLERNQISKDQVDLLAEIAESTDEARKWAGSDVFAEWIAVVLQLTEDLTYNRGNPLFTIQEKVIKSHSDPAELSLFLQCLAWWFRDLLHVKLGVFDDLAFQQQLQRLQMQESLYSIDAITNMLVTVITTKDRLQYNVNVQLAFEHMILRLQEVKHVYSSRGAI
ncbi:DNA polymerase III subunit delta' [Fodinisporobacter ferrooxydans]|uniref:DNA polymerase III subunit delta' n=1 Tax=Fodinisporobacter ferrooxydans TaxID=2901836 RepID=A0ABY4CRD3_9BACL|nr:DNA polymerase III subunit delta' [Alicyclobacillaceae bacterium MYW30-H2]